VDLASGEIAWRSVLGERDMGSLNLGGSMATAGGVVFIGATNDSRFRAFDSKTGKLLWEATLEASGHSSPITYMGRDGRQYVALMAEGGGGFLDGGISNSLVAFALPDGSAKPVPTSVSRTASAATAALPPGDAKKLVERTCGTGCHSLDVVTSQRMSEGEWSAMVQHMVARGARASDAEVQAIVEYLAKTFPASRPR
jgi:cytochrome c5